MGTEPATTPRPSATPPRLCYRALPRQRPEPLGMVTPPLRAPGSVPFQWEEAPGKPRSSDLGRPKPSSCRRLDPPPKLSMPPPSSSSSSEAKVVDVTSSATTVIHGPYYVLLGPSVSLFDGPSVMARSNSLSCSSFSFGERSFRYYGVGGGGGCGGLISEKKKKKKKEMSTVWFCKGMGKRDGEGEPAHPLRRSYSTTTTAAASSSSSIVGGDVVGGGGGEAEEEGKVRIRRFRRSGCLLSLSTATAHLWVAPWRSSKAENTEITTMACRSRSDVLLTPHSLHPPYDLDSSM